MTSKEQEDNLRRAGRIASGVTVAFGVIALILAFRGDKVPASIVLTLALISLAVTWLFYRRYQSMRVVRWQHELADTESEMTLLLESEAGKQGPDQPEETPLARP